MTCSRWSLRTRRGGPRVHARGSRGQATVEFAFLLPLVVLAALAVIQVGLVVRDQMGVVHAAREAARAASVDRDPVRAGARRKSHAAACRRGGRRAPTASGGEISVTVRYHSVTNLPLVGVLFPDPDLRASSTMRVER